MTRQRANPVDTSGPSNRLALWWSLAIATAAIVGIVILALGGSDDGALVGSGDCEPVDGVSHVHGLGVSHEDPDVVYVATHHGLIRVTNGTTSCRLGPIADYMGFTMHPSVSDTFWVSGHPGSMDDRMRLGPNMGVLKSTDGGHSWEQIALKGVDFHALTVSLAEPDRLWGVYAGQVYRSDDGGHTWDTIGGAPTGLFALSGAPGDRDVVYAATQTALLVSRDGGNQWETLTDRAARTIAAHPDGSTLFAVFAEGLHRSTDDGATWERLALDTEDGLPIHLATSGFHPDRMYAATSSGGLYQSTDRGATWTRSM